MQVQKYRNSDTPIAHLLEIGDVFRTDSSYEIKSIKENDTLLEVMQPIDVHGDTGEKTVTFDASICSNTTYRDRGVTLDEILRVKEISVRDKFFVAVNVEIVQCPAGPHITAQECDKYGTPKKNGLTLKFYQYTGRTPAVLFPNVVTHNKKVAKQFKEKPKVA